MSEKVRIIKKYPNRRLYDTEASSYIALNDILQLIREEKAFKVIDTQSEEDITRSVLVQIIIDQENGDKPLFTTDMLENFIRHYDENTRLIFSEFLEKNFELFADQRAKMQDQLGKLVGGDPLHAFTDMAQSNLDFWQRMQSNFLKSAGLKSGDEK